MRTLIDISNFRMTAVWIAVPLLIQACQDNVRIENASNSNIMVMHVDPKSEAKTIYLTKDEKDTPVICWSESDSLTEEKHLYLSYLNDGQFLEILEVPIDQQAKLHGEGMPKVVFKGNGDVLAFSEVRTSPDINGRAGEIRFSVSTDRGKTWGLPSRVHTDDTPGKGHSFFDITRLRNGEVACVWLDTALVATGRSVKFAQTNPENNFIGEVVVDTVACQCCRTAIYSDSTGLISVVYRDIINESVRDISVAASFDSGRTFNSPICFSGDNWNIDGCPHNGPDVVSDEEFIYATWFTGASQSGVYFAKLDRENKLVHKERISSNGRNIQLAIVGREQILVYNETSISNNRINSRILGVKKPSNALYEISNREANAHSPVVIGHGENKFVTAWIEEVNGKDKVHYRVINLK